VKCAVGGFTFVAAVDEHRAVRSRFVFKLVDSHLQREPKNKSRPDALSGFFKVDKALGECGVDEKRHNQGGQNPEKHHCRVRRICRKLMQRRRGMDKPRLETSKTDGAWDNNDDKRHLAENEARGRHGKVFPAMFADVDFACR
jgi:hypothetical protein